MRFACAVEYDGAGFSGWQRQAHARSVQAAVEQALSFVADHPVQVSCAGRTDAGVHATWQIIHFDTDARRSEREKPAPSYSTAQANRMRVRSICC